MRALENAPTYTCQETTPSPKRSRRAWGRPALVAALLALPAALLSTSSALAGCDVFAQQPGAKRAALGSTRGPFCAPGQPFELILRPAICGAAALSADAGFPQPASAYDVNLVYTPADPSAPRNVIHIGSQCPCPAGTPAGTPCDPPQPQPGLNGGKVICAPPDLLASREIVEVDAGVLTERHLRFTCPDLGAAPFDLGMDPGLALSGGVKVVTTLASAGFQDEVYQAASTRCADLVAANPGELVTCADELYAINGTCLTTPDSTDATFPNVIALAPANDFSALCQSGDTTPRCSGGATPGLECSADGDCGEGGVCQPPCLGSGSGTFNFTTDQDGNAYLLQDYSGLLAQQDNLPVPRLLAGETSVPAFLRCADTQALCLGDADCAGSSCEPVLMDLPSGDFLGSYTVAEGLKVPPLFVPAPGESAVGEQFTASNDSALIVVRSARRAPDFQQCSNDPFRPCTADEDCPGGSCGTGTCRDAQGAPTTQLCSADAECPGAECGASNFSFFGRAAGEQCAQNLADVRGLTTRRLLSLQTIAELEENSDGPLCGPEDEFVERRDKTGDGDELDPALVCLDRETFEVRGLDGPGSEGLAVTTLELPPQTLAAFSNEGDLVAALISEPQQGPGGTDFNANGRKIDSRLQAWRIESGAPAGTPADSIFVSAGSAEPDPVFDALRVDSRGRIGRSFALANGRLFYRVSEAANTPVEETLESADGVATGLSAGGAVVLFTAESSGASQPGDAVATTSTGSPLELSFDIDEAGDGTIDRSYMTPGTSADQIFMAPLSATQVRIGLEDIPLPGGDQDYADLILDVVATAGSSLSVVGGTTANKFGESGSIGATLTLDPAEGSALEFVYVGFSASFTNDSIASANVEGAPLKLFQNHGVPHPAVFYTLRDSGAVREASAAYGPGGCSERLGSGIGASYDGVVDASGEWVGFTSQRAGLVAGDANGVADVFLHNTQTCQSELVSQVGGVQFTTAAGQPSLAAADGSVRVAFEVDSNIYLFDRGAGSASLVAAGSDPALSPDAKRLAFVAGGEVLVRELASGITSVASVDGDAGNPSIQSDLSERGPAGLVAFEEGVLAEIPEVLVAGTTGEALRSVAACPSGGFSLEPAFSDNRYLAVTRLCDDDEVEQVMLIDVLTGHSAVVAGGADAFAPVISQDGHSVGVNLALGEVVVEGPPPGTSTETHLEVFDSHTGEVLSFEPASAALVSVGGDVAGYVEEGGSVHVLAFSPCEECESALFSDTVLEEGGTPLVGSDVAASDAFVCTLAGPAKRVKCYDIASDELFVVLAGGQPLSGVPGQLAVTGDFAVFAASVDGGPVQLRVADLSDRASPAAATTPLGGLPVRDLVVSAGGFFAVRVPEAEIPGPLSACDLNQDGDCGDDDIFFGDANRLEDADAVVGCGGSPGRPGAVTSAAACPFAACGTGPYRIFENEAGAFLKFLIDEVAEDFDLDENGVIGPVGAGSIQDFSSGFVVATCSFAGTQTFDSPAGGDPLATASELSIGPGGRIQVEADSDGDGIYDSADNCPLLANADQADFDGDGAGDDCDAFACGDGLVQDAEFCDPAVEDAAFAEFVAVCQEPQPVPGLSDVFQGGCVPLVGDIDVKETIKPGSKGNTPVGIFSNALVELRDLSRDVAVGPDPDGADAERTLGPKDLVPATLQARLTPSAVSCLADDGQPREGVPPQHGLDNPGKYAGHLSCQGSDCELRVHFSTPALVQLFEQEFPGGEITESEMCITGRLAGQKGETGLTYFEARDPDTRFVKKDSNGENKK